MWHNSSSLKTSMASITIGRAFVPGLFPVLHHEPLQNRRSQLVRASSSPNRKSVGSENERLHKSTGLKDYFEQSTKLIKASARDGGPPRWFSPLDGGPATSRYFNSYPLLLFLPGVLGVGLELTLQHKKLGEIFEIWCLHIPIKDRTPFEELVMFVEETVRSESKRKPGIPIYLVGECFGGCLSLFVAARNQQIDLSLILTNPATSLERSGVQSVVSLLELMPKQQRTGIPLMLNLFSGIPTYGS